MFSQESIFFLGIISNNNWCTSTIDIEEISRTHQVSISITNCVVIIWLLYGYCVVLAKREQRKMRDKDEKKQSCVFTQLCILIYE